MKFYVNLAYRHSFKLLGLILVLSLIMGFFATRLSIQTDLRVLLPQGTPSVSALELSEKRMGSTDFYTIAFQDSSIERVAKYQDLLVDAVVKWPEVTMVQYDQDPTFFENHALLYFPSSQLNELRDRLSNMITKGKEKANPFLLDLVGDDAASVPANLDGWPDPMALYREGLPRDVVSIMLKRIDEGKGTVVVKDTVTLNQNGVRVVIPKPPDSLASRMIGYNENMGVWVGVVMARLNQPSTDAGFAGVMKARGDSLINAKRSVMGLDSSFLARIVGAYRDPSSEIDQVNSDMWFSGILAIVLILGLLAFYMHRPANVAVVFVPLLVAMLWMMGAADLIFGRLTVLTSFVIALLSGLGIEYNIHIYSRWIEERRGGLSDDSAMVISLQRTGRSLVSAMSASIVCMLALQIGHFQGFKEFGIVISLGIFFAFISAIFFMPPLLFAVLRMAAWIRRYRGSRYDWFLPSTDVAAGATLVPKMRFTKRFVRNAFALTVVISIVLLFAPQVGFENDFRNLRGNKTGAGMRYSVAIDKGQSSRPSMILGSSEEQMREVHTQLGKRFGAPADSMLKSFITIASFVPSPEDQEERLEILTQIRAIIDGPDLKKADNKTQNRAEQLRKYLDPAPFTFTDLPPYAQSFMTEVDGSHGKVGYIYSEFLESDATEGLKFQERFHSFTTRQGVAPVASSGFIYADVVRMVKEDSGKLAIFVFIFLAIVVLIDTRSWRGFLVNMTYVGMISLWTWGMMGWLGWKVGMFNIVVIPALLSNTVDATIHLYHRRMEMGAGKLSVIYNTAGSSVLAGTLTNAFGFTALCFVSHAGLRTIGLLATLGYVAGISIMFLTMPFLLEYLCPKNPQIGHAGV